MECTYNEKDRTITITLPAEVKNPPPSASGKTKVVASTRGAIDGGTIDGKVLKVNCTVYVYA